MPPLAPLIGLTVSTSARGRYVLAPAYAQCIAAAGGVPLLLPYHLEADAMLRVLGLADGLLLCGGDDLDPSLWGEDWHPMAERIDPDRQRFELDLLARAEQMNMPILGICLGCQIMNVHRGGSLIQFLPDHPRDNPLEHRMIDNVEGAHPVEVVRSSVLAGALDPQGSAMVNTMHKQAIGRLGWGLVASAAAPDGVIEAVEDPSRRLFLGVQWHPERMRDDPVQMRLFAHLVSAAAEWKSAGRRP